MEYDIIVVGAGFAGSTVAYNAAKSGKRVLLLEKRAHIAGNMYDYKNELGILVQKYGPHSFHTNNERVYNFIKTLGDWKEFILKARVMIDGKTTPSPFNLKTVDDFFIFEKANEIKEHLKMQYGDAKKTTIVEMLESNDEIVREYANFLFEKDYKPYTAKQWSIDPEELDISVLKRVPVRLDYTDGYFDDKYQLIPESSFTEIFENMLSDDLIDVRLSCDALKHLKIVGNLLYFDGEAVNIPVVYTGPIDELFNCCYGELPYRSLFFDLKIFDKDSYQETPGVAYPIGVDFTRITEFKKIPPQKVDGVTTVAFEYPVQYGSDKGNEPYYPILTEDSLALYNQYSKTADTIKNLVLCGRLAEFKYYNMDQVIERALDIFYLINKLYWSH